MTRESILAVSGFLLILATYGSVALIYLWESMDTRRKPKSLGAGRQITNFLLGFLTQAVSAYALPVFGTWLQAQGWLAFPGLLRRYPLPLPVAAGIALLWMEFTQYAWHWLSHKVPILWRVHRVHHSDLEVDTTTAVRHHPFEELLGAIATTPMILLLGPEPILVLGWSVLSLVADGFNHGNIRLPFQESWLRKLIVTPRFHCVHHSADQAFTDSNYSKVVPWFDYLFGTARMWTLEEEAKRRLGLERFRDSREQHFVALLLEPFR